MTSNAREDATERYRIGDFTLWVATDDLAERVTGKRWTVWLGHAGETMTFDQAEGVVMALGDTRQEAVQEAVTTLEALTAKLQETPPPPPFDDPFDEAETKARINAVRDVAGVDYATARRALRRHGWDVAAATERALHARHLRLHRRNEGLGEC